MGRSIYCGEMYDHVYDMDNYIIDISGDKKDGLCVVYCSSSGLYYPNTKDEFKRVFIDHQDRFEWRNHRIRGAAKTIWIRDITKEFYVKGINSRINNIDKLIGFLKEQVNGYELITVGSSGGGYIAALLGCVLNAKKVYCFSGFFNLNIIDQDTWPLIFELGNFDEYNKWYRIDKLIEKSVTEIFYFYPCLLQDDCKQASFVEKLENVRTFCFKSSIHGIPFLHLFYDGKIAVCMFWVLSGYYITKKMMRFSVKIYVLFLAKKFFRLYPLYMLSLIVGTIFCNMRLTFDELYFTSWFSGFWNRSVSVFDLQKQLVLRGDFNIINPPSWTMKSEFEMTILLPIILAAVLLIAKKGKWINLCLLICTFFVIGGGKIRFFDITAFPVFCLGTLILLNNNQIKQFVNNKSQWIIFVVCIFLMNIGNTGLFSEYNPSI